jgi:hypothetical protein
MKRRVTIRLDKVLRPDQLSRLAERAIDSGLAEIDKRNKAYEEGKRRPKRRAFVPLSKVFQNVGMTLTAAARGLVREEQERCDQAKKQPQSVEPRARTRTKKGS